MPTSAAKAIRTVNNTTVVSPARDLRTAPPSRFRGQRARKTARARGLNRPVVAFVAPRCDAWRPASCRAQPLTQRPVDRTPQSRFLSSSSRRSSSSGPRGCRLGCRIRPSRPLDGGESDNQGAGCADHLRKQPGETTEPLVDRRAQHLFAALHRHQAWMTSSCDFPWSMSAATSPHAVCAKPDMGPCAPPNAGVTTRWTRIDDFVPELSLELGSGVWSLHALAAAFAMLSEHWGAGKHEYQQ